MGKTVINVGAIIESTRMVDLAKSGVGNARQTFTQTKNGIDSRIKDRADIRNRLDRVQRQLQNIDVKLGRIRSTVQNGAVRYRDVDANVDSMGKQIFVGMAVSAVPQIVSGWASFFHDNNNNTISGQNDEKAFQQEDDRVSVTLSGKSKSFEDNIEEKLKDKDWFDKKEKTKYYKNGKEIQEKEAPDFYDKQLTLGEIKGNADASVSVYSKTAAIGEKGSLSVTVGEAEAHASVAAGFYVIGADGKKKFSPGVNAEVGASVTAFETEWNQQWLGDEDFGLNSELTVTAGKAEVQGEVGIQLFGEDGKVDMQLGAGVSAEIIGGEIEGNLGVNILGGEVGVTGSVNYGVGAHADIGLRDGVFKCDVGASLGVGVSVGFEVDVGGMVDTATDNAKAVWDGIESGWNSFWSGF